MKTTLLLSLLIFFASCEHDAEKIDISGTWSIRLDSTDVGLVQNWQGKIFETPIVLPGTTDDAGLGIPTSLEPELKKPQLTYLTRKNSYIGAAWYSRKISIPEKWSDKEIIFNMERALWHTKVWIDNTEVDVQGESLSAPHIFNLSQYLEPGKEHMLTVRVDNRKRYDISNDMAHSYTDHTQIKWNGILGEIFLEAAERVRITDLQLFPDIEKKTLRAVVSITNNTQLACETELTLEVKLKNGNQTLPEHKQTIYLKPGNSKVDITYKMGDNISLWSEFTPNIYIATSTLKSEKTLSVVKEEFGMRNIYNEGNKMIINGKPLFLRGTLECCIFPLTGTPPMNKEGWHKVFSAAKDYGLNHLRFHSWCPPKAAFEVADEMGFYLQVELPVWVLTIGQDSSAIKFMREEGERIISNYGNHPSFCMWSLGNELQGDFSVLSSILNELKAKDTRHLYTTTSFTFEGGHGAYPETNDDFFVTQWTNKGWVRGQGVFNQQPPSFDKDYADKVDDINIPIITHEIGQYSVYPDLEEISKYTGVLKPLNFIAIKNDLEKKGLIQKAPSYLAASGKLAALLYKEEIERALKSEGISGFQLLDLHDFPGQGTALVGLLNAFWESKGIVSGKEFRESCSPVVPLLRFPKAVYTNNELFEADIELSNYGKDILTDKTLKWQILKDNRPIAVGDVDAKNLDWGHNGSLGKISVELNSIEEATKLEVVLSVDNSDYVNRWNIWIYPKSPELQWGDVKYTRDYSQAISMLQQGEKVLFNPDAKTMKGIEGKFVPVFWSPVHFPKQAGTMGILCNPKHKSLSHFPTDIHTDWQWWDLLTNSTTMIIDSLHGGSPIVEMIDNFTNNRRLASLLEGGVGNGKLMLASFDLSSDVENRPVALQMLSSLLQYMNSSDFNPQKLTNFEKMGATFETTLNKSKESEMSIY